MDETPFYFDNVPNRTVEQVGAKTVRVLTTGSEKKRCTVVLCISDTGEFLTTMIIFKGKRKLKLIHPDSVVIRVQEKGWMNEELMLEWIELCVRPYTERKPSLLILDSFKGHLTKDVNSSMKKMNVLPAVIPGGCTSLLQPLDVCINKPLKDHAKKLWMVYMPSMNNSTRSTKPTTKQQIVEWVAGISSDMVVKSFKVTGLSNNLDVSESHMINENIIVNSIVLNNVLLYCYLFNNKIVNLTFDYMGG